MPSKELINEVSYRMAIADAYGESPIPDPSRFRRHAEAAIYTIFAALQDASGTMVDEAVSVDWSNEDERATAHNVWHAMLNASPLGEQIE